MVLKYPYKTFPLFVLLLILPLCQIQSENAVTYAFAGGRFGDKMLCYLHAKWVSYKYGLPLYYIPFEYSDCFRMHHQEVWLDKAICENYPTHILVKDPNEISSTSSQDTLFFLPYYVDTIEFSRDHETQLFIPVDWKDPLFKRQLVEMLKPAKDFDVVAPPANTLSIAVHYRTGGGFDPNNAYKKWPTKFPPQSYYVDQIRYISNKFNGNPIYVYVFTDDQNPGLLVKKLMKAVKLKNITYGFRKWNNAHNKNVMEDFFSMLNFNCLIRPDSNFSFAVEKIGNFFISISPAHHRMHKHKVIIDEVHIEQP